jgi:hypothetical protein
LCAIAPRGVAASARPVSENGADNITCAAPAAGAMIDPSNRRNTSASALTESLIA